MSVRLTALMYHDVVEPDQADSSGFPGADAALYKLSPSQLEAHFDAVARAGPYRGVSVLTASGRSDLLITFDDGGGSAHPVTTEILESRGWVGHFFVTSGRVGSPTFVTVEAMRRMHRVGHVIGSHSATHPTRMSRCGPEELRREWSTSVRALSDILGEQVTVASVPGGHFSREVAEAASECGIRFLFTSEPTTRVSEVAGCRVLGRYTLQRWMPPETAAGFAQRKLALRAREALLWNAKKVAKAVAGDAYLALRARFLG